MGSGSTHSGTERRLRHDLANWLTVAAAHLELLRSDLDGGAARWRLDRARAALDACRSLLVAEATEPGAPEPRTDLVDVVDEMFDHARSRGSGVEFRHDLGELPPVALPGVVFGNALLNLFENARRALAESTRGEGAVTVSARVTGSGIVLLVRDNGPGMDPEQIAQALRSGFTTRSDREGGSGLQSVRTALGAYGGTVEIESEPGRGTVVRLGLPCSRAAGGWGGGAPIPDEPGSEAPVVLVEDDPEVAGVLMEMLRVLGHRVRWHSSGVDVLADLGRAGAELLLLDLGLPDGSGLDLAERIRQAHVDMTIVLLTGDPRAATARNPQVVDRVVAKPVGLDALREIVEGARERRAERTREAGA